MTVTGVERLAWDQIASTSLELSRYQYFAYIDGGRIPIEQVQCSSAPASSGFACSAPLPALSIGRHVIELVTAVTFNGGMVESPRSPPIVVNKVAGFSLGVLPGPGDQVAAPGSAPSAFRMEVIGENLSDPVALATLPDRRLLVAERGGAIRILVPGHLAARLALGLGDIGEENVVVHSLALHPDFKVNGLLMLLYTALDESHADMRLVRLRLTGDTLGEPAVLLDGVPSNRGGSTGAMTFGADHRLYVATNDAGSPGTADDAGTLSGKILRLNDDGTTPLDNPDSSPVFATGLGTPIALEWNPVNGRLWLLDTRGARAYVRQTRNRIDVSHWGGAIASRAVPTSAQGRSGARLLVGMENRVRWLRFAPSGLVREERAIVMATGFGSLGALAAGTDGSVYVASRGRPGENGRSDDVVVRILPATGVAADKRQRSGRLLSAR